MLPNTPASCRPTFGRLPAVLWLRAPVFFSFGTPAWLSGHRDPERRPGAGITFIKKKTFTSVSQPLKN